MTKVKVVLNEQHKLMEDQKRVLDERFTADGWELYPVPSTGWTLEQMKEVAKELKNDVVIFASPVPALMTMCNSFYVLHNDHREKKELPGGKIIMTVAREGWQIV